MLDLSAQPAVDRRNLLRWLFFNLYVGKHDSHAKNLSLLATVEGLRLAPFYDLMSTRVYSGLGANFALSIGGEFETGRLSGEHVRALAKSLRVPPKYLTRLALDMRERIEEAAVAAVAEIEADIDPHAAALAQRLLQFIRRNAEQLSQRMLS